MNPTALRVKLNKGAGRNGTTLTPAECKFLLHHLPPLPRRRGPKPDPNLKSRDARIAELVKAYEAKGYPVEAAVAKAMEIYGVARSHVYACHARWVPTRRSPRWTPKSGGTSSVRSRIETAKRTCSFSRISRRSSISSIFERSPSFLSQILNFLIQPKNS
jgi:hypothetical protein